MRSTSNAEYVICGLRLTQSMLYAKHVKRKYFLNRSVNREIADILVRLDTRLAIVKSFPRCCRCHVG